MQKAAFTVAEVAEQGSMSRRQVYRLLKAGKLKARKSERKTLILRQDFENWLNSLPYADLAEIPLAA